MLFLVVSQKLDRCSRICTNWDSIFKWSRFIRDMMLQFLGSLHAVSLRLGDTGTVIPSAMNTAWVKMMDHFLTSQRHPKCGLLVCYIFSLFSLESIWDGGGNMSATLPGWVKELEGSHLDSDRAGRPCEYPRKWTTDMSQGQGFVGKGSFYGILAAGRIKNGRLAMIDK